MASKRQDIEDAIIERLGAFLLKSRNAGVGYLSAIVPYNGEVDRFELPEDLKAQIPSLPCILIGPDGGRYRSESTAKTRYGKAIRIRVLLASSHGRSQTARTRSDVAAQTHAGVDPGVYQMEQDVHELLSGDDLDMAGVGQFTPITEDLLIQTTDFTVWQLTFEVVHDAHRPKLDHGSVPLSSYQTNANLYTDEVPNPPTAPNPLAEADGDF